jgi:hypothetical protein
MKIVTLSFWDLQFGSVIGSHTLPVSPSSEKEDVQAKSKAKRKKREVDTDKMALPDFVQVLRLFSPLAVIELT